jgi:hypothetical protein
MKLMRAFFASALLLLTLPCFAAITYVTNVTSPGTGGNAVTTFSFGSSCSAKNVLFIGMVTGVNGSYSVSDSINGAWTPLYSGWNATNGIYLAVFAVQMVSAGDPTITLTIPSGIYTTANVSQFTGYIGTATVDASVGGYAHSNTAVSTMSASAQSHFNNEVLFELDYANGGFSYFSSVSGWTNILAGGEDIFYAIEATPTTNNFSVTPGGTSTYDIVTVGVYDAPASASSSAMFLSQ